MEHKILTYTHIHSKLKTNIFTDNKSHSNYCILSKYFSKTTTLVLIASFQDN